MDSTNKAAPYRESSPRWVARNAMVIDFNRDEQQLLNLSQNLSWRR